MTLLSAPSPRRPQPSCTARTSPHADLLLQPVAAFSVTSLLFLHPSPGSVQMGCSRSSCPVITLVLLALLDRFSQYDLASGPVPMQTTSDYFPLLLGCTSSQHKRTFFLILLLHQELTVKGAGRIIFCKNPPCKGAHGGWWPRPLTGTTSCPFCG